MRLSDIDVGQVCGYVIGGLPASQVSAEPKKKLMRDDAAPVTIYLHPQARKALKRYAMENDVKVHDLLLEAMEAWFEAHGISGPVRVQPESER